MPVCPMREKVFDLRAWRSYSSNIQSLQPAYWIRAKRLRLMATLTLLISILLTVLLIVLFYSPDVLGFGIMGMAALFLAFSSAFSLRERGLVGKYRRKAEQKGSNPEKTRRRTQ